MNKIVWRGLDVDLNIWVKGTILHITNGSTKNKSRPSVAYIAAVMPKYAKVRPETVGRMRQLKDIQVFPGDIVKYAFGHEKQLYHRYYVFKDDDNGAYFEELWRDYRLVDDDTDVERGHFTDYAGTRVDIPDIQAPTVYLEVVGDIFTREAYTGGIV